MIRLINNAHRALGLPGARSVVLKRGGSEVVEQSHFEELMTNRTVAAWIAQGIITAEELNGDEKQPSAEPKQPQDDKKKPSQVQMIHQGGGWWKVLVNGHEATDKNVRKEKAEQIAAEYN